MSGLLGQDKFSSTHPKARGSLSLCRRRFGQSFLCTKGRRCRALVRPIPKANVFLAWPRFPKFGSCKKDFLGPFPQSSRNVPRRRAQGGGRDGRCKEFPFGPILSEFRNAFRCLFLPCWWRRNQFASRFRVLLAALNFSLQIRPLASGKCFRGKQTIFFSWRRLLKVDSLKRFCVDWL